jgi:hypothetical protein
LLEGVEESGEVARLSQSLSGRNLNQTSPEEKSETLQLDLPSELKKKREYKFLAPFVLVFIT